MSKATIKVLIIDDDASITRVFSRILQRKGYQTDVAQSGKEAIEKSKANCYNVALIDICLPDMNGLELLSKLDDHGCRMVQIILTGFPQKVPKGSKAPDVFLLKPVKPQELISAIEQKTRSAY